MFRILNKLILLAIILILAACANRSRGPQGGPRDLNPPKTVQSTPLNGVKNFSGKRIEIEFDEYIKLDNPGEKVIVSPPQLKSPIIKTVGKKIVVELKDSLKENSSYSIDFTDAIQDLNESNKIESYTFSFSTGDELDSLEISGAVLDAETLNPQANILVSLYEDLTDTAFTKTVPLRITKTDNKGYFHFRNLKDTEYHLFALKDLNHDYYYNDPNETMAFKSETIRPSIGEIEVTDTIHIHAEKEEDERDSIVSHIEKVFLPNDLILKSFQKDVYKQYFTKAERKEASKISFLFKDKNFKKPLILPLNFSLSDVDKIQYSANLDTIQIWLGDSALIKKDSLNFSVSYQKADSVGEFYTQTDTTTAFFKIQVVKKEKKKDNEEVKEETVFFKLKTNISGALDIYKPISFEFETPVAKMNLDSIHLYKRKEKDTIWSEIKINIEALDEVGLRYKIENDWDPKLYYKFEIDSAGIVSFHNTHNNKLSSPFNVKSKDKYATVIVSLINPEPNCIIQLLDKKDLVIKQLSADSAGTVFEYINPGDYYLRLFIDQNQNQMWDTGDYDIKQQAEEVFYFDKMLHLRANWDLEQEWDYKSINILEQKPVELLPTKK